MALAATERDVQQERAPEHALQTLAIAEEPNSQPMGRCSMRRPRTALRMMMNGTGKGAYEEWTQSPRARTIDRHAENQPVFAP